ncbi:MFS transporter [Arcanobacterium hippocoleae]
MGIFRLCNCAAQCRIFVYGRAAADFWVSSILGVFLLGVQLFWQVEIPVPAEAQKAGNAGGSEMLREPSLSVFAATKLVLRNPKLWAVMGFSLLTWSMYQIYESQMFPDFFTSHFQNPALGQRVFGIFVGIQAICETLLMVAVPVLLRKFGAKRIVLAAAFVMAFIVFSSAIADSIVLIMLTKVFHALMVPLLVLGIMEYITEQFDLRLTATVYLIGYYVTSFGGNIIFSKPFGMLRDLLGYQSVFAIFGVLMLLGMCVVHFAFAAEEK